MSKRTEASGQWVAEGVWKLKRDVFLVRVQVRDASGAKKNRRRILEGSTLTEALLERDRIRAALSGGTSTGALRAATEPVVSELGTSSTRVSQAMTEPVSSATSNAATTSRPSLGDFAESWLARKKARGDLEERTLERYATALDHLSRRLVRTPVDEVTPEMIEDWVAASTRRFSPTTINGWLRVLRACLKAARLPSNPALEVPFLREPVNLEEPNALPPDQLKKLLTALSAHGHVIEAAAWTQALTGCRWQEVSAFRWDDLDRDQQVLFVRRKAVKGKLVPRTKTGVPRIVGVPPVLAKLLREHRRKLTESKHPGLASGLMFPSNVGTPLASSRISDALRAACKTAGIRQRFTSHGFRRSMTDMLRKARVDPVIAAAVVGHETERMRRHYSTIDPDDARAAGEQVAARLMQPSAPRKAG